MHYTRRELLDDFVALVGDKGDSETRDLASGCLNRALLDLWMQRPWRAFRSPTPLSLTLVPNQRSYPLPDYFGRVGTGEVRNATRGGAIQRLEDGELEHDYPHAGTSLEVSGIPKRYEIAGSVGVQVQPDPVGGWALEAVSSSGGDVDVDVEIAGTQTTGWTRAAVRLNGVVAVALGTWLSVDEASKAYTQTATPVTAGTSSRGTVTIRRVGVWTVLQTLLSQESARQHDVLTLYPKPNAADVVVLPVIRKPKRLFQDADPVPDLWAPALFEAMLIDWQVITGELALPTALSTPRPKLLELIAFENQQHGTIHKKAFGMGA